LIEMDAGEDRREPSSPRRMELEELIATLVLEHGKMKKGLAEVRAATLAKDFLKVAKILREVDAVFRQHIADEEGQVLRLLVGVYGAKGSEEAVAVFRQHRPIYQLMESLGRFATLTPDELASNGERLVALLDEHTNAEETRIFPWAISTRTKTRN